MEAVSLTESEITRLLASPETGMGYQSGSLISNSRKREGYFVSSFTFIPIATTSRGSLFENFYFSKGLEISPPIPKQSVELFAATANRVIVEGTSVGRLLQAATGGLPPHETITKATDVFFRVSAYRNDQRVRADGSLQKESYSTTDTDITVVPSGLAAVGRYALPTRVSSRHVFKIVPGAGVKVLFGTVTPNYGLCGGGVEVYFPEGTKSGTVTYLKELPEK